MYGNLFVDTPNPDWLTRDGVAYERTCTLTALCTPARTALMTGEKPHKNGVTRNLREVGMLLEDCDFYPQRLR